MDSDLEKLEKVLNLSKEEEQGVVVPMRIWHGSGASHSGCFDVRIPLRHLLKIRIVLGSEQVLYFQEDFVDLGENTPFRSWLRSPPPTRIKLFLLAEVLLSSDLRLDMVKVTPAKRKLCDTPPLCPVDHAHIDKTLNPHSYPLADVTNILAETAALQSSPRSMSALCWNCQGLGGPSKVRGLENLIHCYGIGVPSRGKSGRLALLWDKIVSFQIQTFSGGHIDATVQVGSEGDSWCFTSIYGDPEVGRRTQTWSILSRLSGQSVQLWLCVGDFNELMQQNEKLGDRLDPIGRSRIFGMFYCQLERAVGRGVREGWASFVNGIRAKAALHYLSACREKLTTWSLSLPHFGRKPVQKSKEQIRMLPRGRISIASRQRGDQLRNQLEAILARGEICWQQWGKVHWLKKGDRNTSIFHANVSLRRRTNAILCLQDYSGNWVDESAALQRLMEHQFSKIFEFGRPSVHEMGRETEHLMYRLDQTVVQDLALPFTEEEIVRALFQVLLLKYPGPNDETRIFSQASEEAIHYITNLLGIYAQASAQVVNFSKSSVVFSRNVELPMQEHLSGILGIRRAEKHDMFLGLPTLVGKSQLAVFHSLRDRVWQRISRWNEKMISQAGKGVLIKVVLQSIPTYAMGVFRIPDAVIRDNQSHCADFWRPNRAGEWRRERLLEVFHSMDEEAILAIPLDRINQQDVAIWHYTLDGGFSVCNAYYLDRTLNVETSPYRRALSWKFICGTEVPPKYRNGVLVEVKHQQPIEVLEGVTSGNRVLRHALASLESVLSCGHWRVLAIVALLSAYTEYVRD
ncbi:hypothetical protein Sango_0352200 [Sesamum angolense]|uniref:Uncharacterized protein n=1 Tax=Sesamum angolense TaxID=2727404 RepID=A0AAE1XA70_9LAMI|nr:hypothetical protein Sango_0352200 [Sesamum angolense]